MGKFTNKTTDGAKRLFALLAVLILLFSGFAHVLATNFGRVKIEQINIDARGALLDGELYYPVGTTDEDSLPAGGTDTWVNLPTKQRTGQRGCLRCWPC